MKAVILDMFGVILKQTGEEFYSYVRQFFPERTEKEIYTIWNRADLGEISSLEVWRQLGFQGNLEEREKEFLDTLEVNGGFYEFASEAGKQCKLAILSNDSSRWSRYIREKFGINPYFDVINISGDLKRKKPDRYVFELTRQQLGVEARECVYIDDRRKNLSAARDVGMDTVLFNSRNVDFGGKTVHNFRELGELLGIFKVPVRMFQGSRSGSCNLETRPY